MKWGFLFNINTERMEFLEKDLEQIIYETSNDKLNFKGLRIDGKKIRQLRIGSYGAADLVSISKKYRLDKDFGSEYYNQYVPYLFINVFELKRKKVGISAFLQAVRYCKGIKRYISLRNNNIDFRFKITLIGREADTTSDFVYLTDLMGIDFEISGISLDSYSFNYTVEGIIFTEHSGYRLTEENFKNYKIHTT